MSSDDLAASFTVSQSTNTQLTPNTNVRATASGDNNDTTQLAFEYNGRFPIWSPSVSAALPKASLGSDVGNGVVTIKAGFEVDYNAQAGTYTLTATGTIVDSNSTYPLAGLVIGTFKSNAGGN